MFLLTDIPEWNAPLLAALARRDLPVEVLTKPAVIATPGLLVNRVSASAASSDSAFAAAVETYLREEAAKGRPIVNGADCYRLGYDKWAQAIFFAECGVRTPETRLVEGGSRALPDRPVLLKPRVGGYGRGIVALEPGEPIPVLSSSAIEQVRLEPVDRAVHRVEIVGQRVLYEAITSVEPGSYNYCLASGEPGTVLKPAPEPAVAELILALARRAGMQIGSIEYLLSADGVPAFIDLNPVSSYHPGVMSILGFDPFEALAGLLGDLSGFRTADLSPPTKAR